jgi:hypothetical protein
VATPAEVAKLLGQVARRWPHAQLPPETGDVWLEDLADVPGPEAHAAVVQWARGGERFPPTSGQVRSLVEQAAQLPPPSFDEVQAVLSRNASCLPYSPDGQHGPEDTAVAVERLAARGVHEAVLRFVAAHGLFAVRMMPDPRLAALDPNQSADRRDKARDYRDRVLPDWKADPRPGVALERCRVAAGLEAGTASAGLRRTNAAALLGAGEE